MSLYRDGKIKPLDPLRVFDSSNIAQAFRHFSSKNRNEQDCSIFREKRVFDQDSCHFQEYEPRLTAGKILPLKYNTTFDSEKTYLMIGCLDELDRSMFK